MRQDESETNVMSEIMVVLTDIRAQLTKIISFTLEDRVEAYIGSSKLRRKVFEKCDGKHTVGDIARETRKAQPNISAVISDLLEKGLIKEGRKVRRTTYYVATP